MVDPEVQQMVKNIRRTYNHATNGEREYGEQWYPVAHAACARIAMKYGVEVKTMAGVISALSPNNKWQQNLVDAERYAKAWAEGNPNMPSASTYPNGRRKAWDLLHGKLTFEDAFDTGTAHKTRAFALSIAEPFTNLSTVVIDGHAVNIAQNVRRPLSEVGTITPKQYDRYAEAYIRAAIATGITPQACQATCWIVWRRANQYSPEFDDDLLLTTERV